MTFQESVRNTWEIESAAIRNLASTIDQAELEKLMKAVVHCRGKVVTCGCGTSGTAGEKIAHTLNCIECPAFFLPPAMALHGGLGAVTRDDIIVLLSKGGNSEEIDAIFRSSREKGALIVSMTENERALIAREADIFIKVKVDKEPDDFNMLATGSTMAVIAVFDAIAIAIMRIRGYDKQNFLRNHPGGDVGKRLADGRA